jgi:hypothetical protein
MDLTPRERLQRACRFWLEGEFVRDVKAHADFFGRTRDICLLADTADDSAILIAVQMFDELILEIEPLQAWCEYEKRWKNEL